MPPVEIRVYFWFSLLQNKHIVGAFRMLIYELVRQLVFAALLYKVCYPTRDFTRIFPFYALTFIMVRGHDFLYSLPHTAAFHRLEGYL